MTEPQRSKRQNVKSTKDKVTKKRMKWIKENIADSEELYNKMIIKNGEKYELTSEIFKELISNESEDDKDTAMVGRVRRRAGKKEKRKKIKTLLLLL